MALDLQQSRQQTADALAGTPLDVLVIGGGIVGAGVARDAAMRGLRVGLVEQHDFASGTSSRTSRLLHGGLRYLAQGRLGLVYQASHEKRVLHRIAPHLAEPLAFVFPTYRGGGWPLWQLRIGVRVYDWLCGGRNLGPSTSLSREQTLGLLPGLASESLTGAVRYYDGLTNDARLVLDTLRSAAAHGAAVANYTRLEEAERQGGAWRCRVRDTESDRTWTIQARCVVSAAGPWASRLPHSRLRLRLTKGVHLVVDRSRLPVPDSVVMTDNGRILFAIPWGERVILGTTDTDYDGPIEAVRTEPDDVQYILTIVNRSFPVANLEPADVLSSWAGVRPLIASTRGGPSDISRAHQVRMAEPGWIEVAGGKLTTYRRIAEDAVGQVVRCLGVKAAECRTAHESLLAPVPQVSPLPKGEATDPISRPERQAAAAASSAASAILPPEPSPELVQHYCTREWAVHLDDVMVRRTSWHYYVKNPQDLATRVAGWMAEALGWDDARAAAECTRYTKGA